MRHIELWNTPLNKEQTKKLLNSGLCLESDVFDNKKEMIEYFTGKSAFEYKMWYKDDFTTNDMKINKILSEEFKDTNITNEAVKKIKKVARPKI